MTFEEKRNLRKAVAYVAVTILLLILFFVIGIPLLAKFAVFLGNINGNKDSVSIVDKTPPAPPRLAPLPSVTSQELISLKGFSESGADISLFLNGDKLKEVVADDGGEFNFSEIKIASGSNELYVTASDRAQNVSQPSGQISIVLDRVLPLLTVTSPTTNQTFSGQQNKNIKVTGVTEEEAVVKVNDRSVIVGTGGKFETLITLSDGEQEIRVIATDTAGNSTDKTIPVKFNP